MAFADMLPPVGSSGLAAFTQTAFDIFLGLHCEIILFMVAFIMHSLVFGKHRTWTRSQQTKRSFKLCGSHKECPVVAATFNFDAFSLVLSRVRSCCEFDQLVAEALEHGRSTLVLGKAAEEAAERCDQALADAVIRRLPESRSEIEKDYMGTVAVLLRVPGAAALRRGQTEREAGEKVIQNFETHFSELDFSINENAAISLLVAALSCERADVVSKLVEPADENRRAVIVERLGARGRLSDVFRVMGGLPQTVCHRAWLEGAILGGDMSLANKVIREAESSGDMNSSLYSILLKAELEKKNVGKARALMRRMSSRDVLLATGSENELVRVAVEKCGEQFFSLLSDMQACGLMPSKRNVASILKLVQQNPRPDDIERMIKFCNCLAGEVEESVFCAIVPACVRSDRAELLGPLLERHWEARKLPASMVHSYGSAIRAYGCLGQVDSMWATWRSLRATPLRLTSVAIGCMVEALVTNGLPNDGYELLRELRQDEAVRPLLNAVMYCSVLKGFSHQKSFSQTWKVYLEMVEDRLEFSIVTFNTLIDACARCGEMSRVPELLKSMQCQSIEPDLITYCAILKGYCRENKLERAFELVENMRLTTSFVPDEIMYNSLLDGCARSGLFDKGAEVLADMEAAGVKPTNFTLSLLMKLAGRGRQLGKAFELFEDIPRRYHFQPNVHVYANLMTTCLQHHALQRAIAVVEKMAQARVRPDARIYGMLIQACIGSGDLKTAEALLRAAFSLRGGFSSLLGLKNASNVLSAQVSEVFDAMGSRHDKVAVELARDLQTHARFELTSRIKMRLSKARP
eukprot:TRINITY_DN135_c0_g1_i8.p1 TRINITY_DN135_c0_g1~~TRINITY_DN135_c0_g1_i8.p1  ORF type:complete len:805 (+),score=106.70 TRINITY_DN135_c0_g1_i8:71-2485(+)